MNAPKIEPKKHRPPQVMLDYVRDEKTGEIKGIRTFDFEVGAVITRCGKRYQLQKDGSQKRL